MSEKPDRDELLASESELLRGLLAAAEERSQESIPVEVARKGKVYFRFRIRALSEREYNDCRDKATTYQRSRQLGGLKLPEDTDMTRYRSLLIHRATVDEDRERLWDNREAWKRLNVLNGADLIDRVLLAGEKDGIVAKIDELSGYGAELEETAKN